MPDPGEVEHAVSSGEHEKCKGWFGSYGEMVDYCLEHGISIKRDRRTNLISAWDATPSYIPEDVRAELKRVIEHSYSPYSNFRVACVITTDDGNTYSGTNVENSSLSQTICAESAAIAQAISRGQDMTRIDCVYVFTDTADSITPCGACRQVISEFAAKHTLVVSIGNRVISCNVISELLTGAFAL